MFDISMILSLFKDYGCGLAEFAIIVWLLWKIANNHLKHIADDVKAVGVAVRDLGKQMDKDNKDLNEKIEETHTKVEALGERVAKVEGQIQK